MVKVNGQSLELDGKNLEEYLINAGYDRTKIAVELNCKIVPKAEYSKTVLCDKDSVEVVSFVGGG